MEATDWSHGREAAPTPVEEWTANRRAENLQERIERNDQLLVNKGILKNCQRLTNLSMAWIDYKKAYVIVSHL